MVSRIIRCLLWVAVFMVSLPGRAEELADRPVLTILRFDVPDGDAELRRFSYLLEKDMAWGLSETRGLRIQSGQHGRRSLKIGVEDSISKDQAVQIGRMVEARRVLTGEMARDGEGWRATVRMVNPANGEAETFAVRGEDWWRFRAAPDVWCGACDAARRGGSLAGSSCEKGSGDSNRYGAPHCVAGTLSEAVEI